MIYNTKNWSNNTAESQEEKRPVLILIFSIYSQSKITELNKMWSLKILTMLKCKSRTSLHAV